MPRRIGNRGARRGEGGEALRPWEPEGVGGVPLADKEGVACLREELIGCEAEWAIWPPPLCLDPGVPW